MNGVMEIWIIFYASLLYFVSIIGHINTEPVCNNCQKVVFHQKDGNQNFTSPCYPEPYPQVTECLYEFRADPRHRVQLTFDDFSLGGNAPKADPDRGFCNRCDHFVDLYTEVNGEFNFPNEQLSGRFCGSVSPGLRISLYNTAIVVFHARGGKPEKGFRGRVQFIDSDRYKLNGRGCSAKVFSHGKKEADRKGSFFSPTYPGKYPPNLFCTYTLVGDDNERIRLFFKDFDLYFGGPHCPYDTVTVYDGDSNISPIINKLCGLQQTLELFSRSNTIHLEFKSVDPPYAEHRGFEIEYKFSKDFVNLTNMTLNDRDIHHISGSECDFRVLSEEHKTVTIRSPNYPGRYPANKTCVYVLEGLQGLQTLEQVSLEFRTFNVYSISALPHEQPMAVISDCPDSIVAIGRDYRTAEQTTTSTVDLCGQLPEGYFLQPIISDSSRLVVTFRSGYRDEQYEDEIYVEDWPSETIFGFEATVRFVPASKITTTSSSAAPNIAIDFGIPFGEPVPALTSSCYFKFKFDDDIHKVGDKTVNYFNSPRYPDDYLANITCYYIFEADVDHLVLIHFDQFSLDRSSGKHDPYGPDRLEMYSYLENGTKILYGNYTSSEWSETMPGPIFSITNNVTVIFVSNTAEQSTGFKAFYRFLNKSEIATVKVGKGNEVGGIIPPEPPDGGKRDKPAYKMKYDKNTYYQWEISVRPGYKILLQPIALNVDGIMKADGKHGSCQKAVIRVFNGTSAIGKEFCGQVLKNPGVRQFVSKSNVLNVYFLTGPEVLELEGFDLLWTEIDIKDNCTHGAFKCTQNKFCISNDLTCNGKPNCGDWDTSDEDFCHGGIVVPNKHPTATTAKWTPPLRRRPTTVRPAVIYVQPTRQLPSKTGGHQENGAQGHTGASPRGQRQQPKPTSPLATMSTTATTGVTACRGACLSAQPDDTLLKTAILASCGVGLVLILVLIIGCVVARRRLYAKTRKTSDPYPSIQRRPLNSSMVHHQSSRHAHDTDLC